MGPYHVLTVRQFLNLHIVPGQVTGEGSLK